MKTKNVLITFATAALLAACGEETRNGELVLSGSAPLKIADEGGKTVEFYSGPLKVEFGADGSRKFSVKLEQNGRTAKFSGKASGIRDWNFSVRGQEIGQPADIASKRTVALHGPIERRWGQGGSCGFNGRWQTEERWQKGDEDWTVSFTDAASGAGIGSFASRRADEYFLIDSQNTWCRERPDHEPGNGGRWDRFSQGVSEIKPSGFRFD